MVYSGDWMDPMPTMERGGEKGREWEKKKKKKKKKNLTCFNSDNKIGRKLKLKHKLVVNLKILSLVSFIFPNVGVRSLTQSWQLG